MDNPPDRAPSSTTIKFQWATDFMDNPPIVPLVCMSVQFQWATDFMDNPPRATTDPSAYVVSMGHRFYG